jgi:hypothetical protein
MMIAIVFEPRLRAIYAFFPTLTDGDWQPVGVTHMTTSGQSRTKIQRLDHDRCSRLSGHNLLESGRSVHRFGRISS